MSLDPVPADRRDSVAEALRQAFSAPIQSLVPVVGGASGALTYRIEVAGRAHLLRIETARDAFRDPRRSFSCMRTAAETGLAPPLQHADAATGIAIMDFIVQRPLTDFPGGPGALGEALAALLLRLREAPVFPRLAPYRDILDRVLVVLRESRLFPPGALDGHWALFERISRAYPWDASAPVSSHNDLNPGNLLFDGQRLWLIDWEVAFRNDPMVDIALVGINFARFPGVAPGLHQRLFGGEPDRPTRARLALMQQLGALYYGGTLLTMFAADPPAQPADLSAPTLAEISALRAAGRLPENPREALFLIGKAFLRAFLEGVFVPDLEEDLIAARLG